MIGTTFLWKTSFSVISIHYIPKKSFAPWTTLVQTLAQYIYYDLHFHSWNIHFECGTCWIFIFNVTTEEHKASTSQRNSNHLLCYDDDGQMLRTKEFYYIYQVNSTILFDLFYFFCALCRKPNVQMFNSRKCVCVCVRCVRFKFTFVHVWHTKKTSNCISKCLINLI